jgi:hypothetical protein
MPVEVIALGNFYTNFTLKVNDATQVAETLRQAKRDAFVAADKKAHCVLVFDREADEQEPAVITKLGKLLSKKHGCPVLAVCNEDDDVFRYWLFDAGKILDTFDSSFERGSDQSFVTASGTPIIIAKYDPKNPADPDGSWQPAKRRKDEQGGNVQTISTAFGMQSAAEKVFNVLLKEYDFVVHQHRALCKALGLSAWAVGGGFEYLERGQLPKGLRKSQLVRVGGQASEA